MFKKCKVKNCDNKCHGKGYCDKHYRQFKRYGKILERTIRDKNEIINYGDYCEICLYNNKKQEVERTKIDKEDLEKVKQYKWYLQNNGYVSTRINNKKILLLHHLILGKPLRGYEIDHKDINPLNNRRNNLRFVTHYQNCHNNKSKGYCWDKRNKKWKVRIMINHKEIWLGYFHNEQDAINARKQAEKKYFGEFAYQKNLF